MEKGNGFAASFGLSCKPMKVLSIQATQNNLSEAGKAIPFEVQWASHFVGSVIQKEIRAEE